MAERFPPADARSPAIRVGAGLPPGLTRGQLRSAAFSQVTRDVYLPARVRRDRLARYGALLGAFPTGAAFCLQTASAFRGLPLPTGSREQTLHVAVNEDGWRPRRRGVVIHQWQLPMEHIELLGDLPLVTAARNLLEMAQHSSLEDLVALGDASLRQGAMSLDECAAVIEEHGRGRRGVSLARKAVRLLDGRSESAMESWVRIWCQLAGLPRATPNVWITDEANRRVARVDLLVDEFAVAIEYEGAHHRDAEQYAADLRRRNLLEALGLRIVHLERSMLRSRVQVVQAVAAVLRLQRWTGAPDWSFSSDWS